MSGSRPQLGAMEKIIKVAVDRGASDLHIKAGDVFRARIDGKLVPLTKQRLTPDQTRAIALHLVHGEDARARIDRLTDFDCSWGMPGVGRFRVNLLRQRSSVMIVLRVIPFAVPTLATLGAPEALGEVASAERGLVLVAGLGGAGKSSTVAAMVDHINREHHRHVVTIENPIGFLHRDLHCSITQREVGVDTDSVVTGLRAALRQDPDVIVVGDAPDAETLDTALKAAETGRLVILEMPAADAAGAVARAQAFFAPEEREIGRLRLAENLRAVVAQQLLPRADGAGRVAAFELLPVGDRARDALRDPEGLAAIGPLLAGAADGAQGFAAELERLRRAGAITDEAERVAAAAVGVPVAGADRRRAGRRG
ncbi:MAG TPA: PilT/PilU family type 4a pilus ATPase [Gemmatimonadales bacterium]|nr:PilT/PilU family type 4a pilus ATPase [Gemmatimonadales bacterium]